MTSQELYQLLAPAGDGCFVTDSRGAILFWGPLAERCFGWPCDDSKGKRCWEVLGSSGGPEVRTCEQHCELISEAVALRPGSSRQVKLQTRDKAKWFSESTFGAVAKDQGHP